MAKIELLFSGKWFYSLNLLQLSQVSFFLFSAVACPSKFNKYLSMHSIFSEVAANSLSPQRKRCRTEDYNVESRKSADLSLPKRVSGDGQTAPSSETSKSPTVDVRDIRFAKMLLEKSKRIGNLEELYLYAVPLARSSTKIGRATFNRFVFDVRSIGENDIPLQMNRMREIKTILLVGTPDSGKTSLINNIFNFIAGVDWNDPFSFIIKKDGREEKDVISVYEIRQADGFRISFSLTIVDVPFCNHTPSKDFAEMLGNFFQSENAIQQVNVIGFVAQTNVSTQFYDPLLSFFGKDLKGNLTYIDAEPSKSNTILKSLSPHEFKKLAFEADGPDVRSLRRNQWDSFQEFFQSLAKMNHNGLKLTKQVLEVRTRMEVTFGEMRRLVENGTILLEKVKKTKQIIADCQTKIEAKKNVDKTTQKTNLPAGRFASNCNNCGVTCSVYRSLITSLDTPSCSMCPGKCSWNSHLINLAYRLESTVEDVPGEENVKKLETHSKILEELIVVERGNSANQRLLRCRVNGYIEELNQISLRPFIVTTEYADLMA